MARKTRAEAQITRQRILDTAGEIFLSQGFAGSSLQQVAEAAGLTRGAIYWHFKSKRQLLDALMARPASRERSNGNADDPMRALTRLALAPLERLKRAAPAHHAVGTPGQAGLSLGAAAMRHQLAGEQRTLLMRQLQLACDNVHRHCHLTGSPSGDHAALGLTWLIDGLMWLWSEDPEAFDLLATGGIAISAYVQGMHNCAAMHLPPPD